MDTNMITGIIRAVLPPLLVLLVAKGWVSAGSTDWIVTSVIALVTAGWSVWTNRPAAIAAATQALPGVNVQTSPAASTAVTAAVTAVKGP